MVGNLAVLAACINPWGQSSRLNFCSFLQRHFCVFAMSFPGQEALLTVYSTILAQHLALQRMPPAVQKLQPQLVAAALGEPLPSWGVGRRRTPALAPGECTRTCQHRKTQPHHNRPVPWEPYTTPPHHGTVQMKPPVLLFSYSRSKHSIVSLEMVHLKPQACPTDYLPSCRRSWRGEQARLGDPARSCSGL